MKTPCTRLHVTAIGIDRNGYSYLATNGNYHTGGCTGEPGNCGCIHAEEELLKLVPDPKVVVISHSPCINCAKLLWEAGVEVVIYSKAYRKTDGIDFLQDKGIQVINLFSEVGVSKPTPDV